MDFLLLKSETEFAHILLQLVEHRLIFDIERRKLVFSDKNERQAVIGGILLGKPIRQSTVILEVFNYFQHNNCSDTNISSVRSLGRKIKSWTTYCSRMDSFRLRFKETHPLLNHAVVNHVSQFLKLEDILTLRVVCSQWKDVADTFIRRLAKIKFGDLKPDAFLRMFADYLPNIPFSAFSFTEEPGKVYQGTNTCFGESLIPFFQKWGKHVKELSWRSVNYFDNEGQEITSLNITELIKACPKLSYLNIQRDNANITLAHVSWDSLVRIKTLILKDCAVEIEKDIKISPSKIDLENIIFFHNKVQLQQIRLNDFLNFSGLKEMTLKYIGLPGSAEARQILVFTGGALNIESLNLDKIAIEDCEEGANWKVDTLHMKNTQFTRKLKIQYKELVVDTTDLDLSSLDETIEKLRIVGCNKTKFTCTQPANLNLPNLKHLSVDFCKNISPIFPDFMRCLNLDEVSFDGEYLTLKVDAIPESVKILKLGKSFKLEGGRKLILDKLILDGYSLFSASRILHKIHTKTLVLRLQWIQNFENNDSVILFLKRYQNSESVFNIERVIIGEFDWDNWEFVNSHLSKKVDTQSKYYEFKQGLGTAINCETFNKEMKLYIGA